MVSDDERRRVAEGLRGLNGNISHVRRVYEDEGFSILCDDQADYYQICHAVAGYLPAEHMHPCDYEELHARLADLIEPSYKPDAKYEAWYNSLSHYGSAQGAPSNIRELIEEIVWAALTVDLGPNGNTDPSTGIDEGDVYTDKLFTEWERDALRLSGGIDRDALLALAEDVAYSAAVATAVDASKSAKLLADMLLDIARRIREALGVSDG